jgi:uroporphyrinogen decarboxylase
MDISIKEWSEKVRSSRKRTAIPLMTHAGIELTGATVREAVTNGEIQAMAIKALYRRFKPDGVTTIMDLTVEAEAFGSKIRFEEDEIPTVSGSLASNAEEVENLSVPDLSPTKRAQEYLRAAALTAKEITDVPVFGGCIGPFSLAGRLMDMTEIMTGIYLMPETVHELLRKCTLFIKEYVRAYKSLGIDGVIMAEPAAGLLGEEECDTYSSAYIKEIVTELQDEDFLVVLHNCGHDGMLARSMVSTGAGALHFGNAADMEKVLQEVPNDVLVMGNLDPVRVLKEGTPEFVKEQTQALLEKTKDSPNFVLSSGCDLPPHVPLENIEALFEALKEFNRERD